MKIVVLDGYTLNPDDLSWENLQKLGEVEIFDRTPPELLIERAKNADIILINKIDISAEIIAQLPYLKYIGLTSTGTDAVDVAFARNKGIKVSNVPNYATPSVAQHTFALILALANQVSLHSDSVKAGDWTNCQDWCYWKTPLVELSGKTIGIVGHGRIGKNVAEVARAFGMNVIVNSHRSLLQERSNIEFVNLKKLFSVSDVVSLHCPLTPENRAFVDKTLLSRMKPTAFLINTSRGGLINEIDLAEALQNGNLAGAGLDVLGEEPPKADNPLLSLPNCIITPHNAWASKEARSRLMDIIVENIKSFLEGNPKNIIDGIK